DFPGLVINDNTMDADPDQIQLYHGQPYIFTFVDKHNQR
ncbi:peptidase M85, partial [Salmonella enterica]|nr:peptidase M85 [Salmonella enterica]ELS0262426.1 peptidase M85 [Salmonella enterica]ELT2661940.1 peptidase M85 [Salmonella enterica]HAE6965855.1 peptidase M85 [Salmonella enterica subsp. enterica serovar Panama]